MPKASCSSVPILFLRVQEGLLGGGGGTRETHHSPSIVLLMLLPSSLLLEMGQQMSQAITPAQPSISTLGLSQQVNMDLELY